MDVCVDDIAHLVEVMLRSMSLLEHKDIRGGCYLLISFHLLLMVMAVEWCELKRATVFQVATWMVESPKGTRDLGWSAGGGSLGGCGCCAQCGVSVDDEELCPVLVEVLEDIEEQVVPEELANEQEVKEEEPCPVPEEVLEAGGEHIVPEEQIVPRSLKEDPH